SPAQHPLTKNAVCAFERLLHCRVHSLLAQRFIARQSVGKPAELFHGSCEKATVVLLAASIVSSRFHLPAPSWSVVACCPPLCSSPTSARSISSMSAAISNPEPSSFAPSRRICARRRAPFSSTKLTFTKSTSTLCFPLIDLSTVQAVSASCTHSWASLPSS